MKEILNIGVNDEEIELFENQFKVPEGMRYNSYLILDEKVAIIDTVDEEFSEEWMNNLEMTLEGKVPDYLVIQHMEPDHTGGIVAAMKKFPNMQLVGNEKTFKMFEQFIKLDIEDKKIVVKENDKLELGERTLNFIMAPMVHWPEVMVSYEEKEKVLFSADGFGKFGAVHGKEDDWACEARRYYFGIVGKFGLNVQMLLKKLANAEVTKICPLHGPELKEDIEYYLDKYTVWSSYEPEDKGYAIVYASLHGNTAKCMENAMAEALTSRGVKAEEIHLINLVTEDIDETVEDAFRYSDLILAASSYNNGVMPIMDTFLRKLASKNFQKRKVALIENGSWAPSAARTMKEILSTCKDLTFMEKTVTINSVATEKTIQEIGKLADEILEVK